MAEVAVNLQQNSYNIAIGCGFLEQVPQYFAGLGIAKRIFIVTDENVGKIYGDRLLDILESGGYSAIVHTVQAGEQSKALGILDEIYTHAVQAELDRSCAVIALGGGVVGDLAGMFAATYMRGLPFIQIPTSLLAQVDSSVGGKVAVNHVLGKNIIGAFYQPKLVIIDPELLFTLPKSELINGLAEVIKYGIIADAALFKNIEDNIADILALDMAAVVPIIIRCCEIKADIVAQDEKESSLRMILNFGHTIGHAVETVTNYNTYTHGQAVAIGMHGAAVLSQKLGLCSTQSVDYIISLLKKTGLPLTAQGCVHAEIQQAILHDKKAVAGEVNWILIKTIGSAVVKRGLTADSIRPVLVKVCL